MKKAVVSCLISASAMALAMPAYAQDTGTAAQTGDDASADDFSRSGVIIVQARRRDESVQDVPAVVQAVSADQIEQFDIRQFEDITSLVPGLDLGSDLGGISGSASLRGVDFDARASGSNATVEFYRNDAVVPTNILFQALYDVDQIEVLRGPQGTLKGRAAPSGSISVSTKKPDLYEPGGYMTGTLAERDRYSVNGAINVPILEGRLGVRVAGFTGENRGNNVRSRNLVTGAIDDDIYDESQSIRFSAQANPFGNDVLVLDFNYEGMSREQRFFPQVQSFSEISATAGASPVTIASDDYLGVETLASLSDQTFKIYNWQAQLNLLGQSLIYLGQDMSGDINFLNGQDFAGVTTSPDANGVPLALHTRSRLNSKVHEIRLQNEERVLGMFDYVVGYLNFKQSTPTTTESLSGAVVAPSATAGAPFIDLVAINSNPILRFRSSEEESFFGNLTMHLGDRIEVAGGIRKIKIRQNSGLTLLRFGIDLAAAADCRGFPDVANCGPASEETIYSASAKFQATDNIMLYGSYGTSYRPGNVSVVTVFQDIGPFLNQFIRLADEKSESFEAGIKTSWFNDTVKFNVTGYHQKFDNFAYRPGSPVIALADVYDPGDTKSLVTFDGLVVPADAKIKGLEAELSWVPSDRFYLSGVLSYTDGKIKNAQFPCVDLNDDNVPDLAAPTADQLYAEVGQNQVDTCLSDTNPGSSPKWAASAVAEYSHPFSPGFEGFARTLVEYKGFNEGVGVNPLDQVKAYTMVDLFLGVRDPDGAWSVSAYAKNLFDTHRVLTRTDAPLSTVLRGGGAFNGTNYLGVTTTLPQEFGVTARIAFGSR